MSKSDLLPAKSPYILGKWSKFMTSTNGDARNDTKSAPTKPELLIRLEKNTNVPGHLVNDNK